MVKINGPLSPQIQVYRTAQVKRQGVQDTKRTWGKDEIEVSQDAQIFSEAFRKAKAELSQPADQARMDKIARDIKEGSYCLEGKELAKSMLFDVEI